MKKKVIASALGIMMLSATVLPAYAADTPVEVSFEQPTTYTMSIPQTLKLSDTDNSTSLTISVSDVNTKPNEKVQIKIKDGITSGNVTLARENDQDTTVVSAVTKDSIPVDNNTVLAEFKGMDKSTSGTIEFSKIIDSNGGEVKAGIYKGTITFEGSLAN